MLNFIWMVFAAVLCCFSAIISYESSSIFHSFIWGLTSSLWLVVLILRFFMFVQYEPVGRENMRRIIERNGWKEIH